MEDQGGSPRILLCRDLLGKVFSRVLMTSEMYNYISIIFIIKVFDTVRH